MNLQNIMFRIAGLNVEIQGAGNYFKKRVSDYILPIFGSENGEYNCDIRIKIKRCEELPYLRESGNAGTALQWRIAVFDDEIYKGCTDVVFRTPPGFDDVASVIMRFAGKNAEISLLCPSELPEDVKENDMRDYTSAGQAMGSLMLEYDRMVMHSSCIVANGKAVLFSAPSGTGKSTHTGLWIKHIPGTEYINDDTPVLSFADEGTVYACGSPWSGKTELNANISAPVAAVVLLERGTENEIERIGGAETFARLLGEARKLPFRRSVSKAADLCARLMENVPVYRLRCNMSPEAAEVVYKEIF